MESMRYGDETQVILRSEIDGPTYMSVKPDFDENR